jgi:hypothetical protein
MGNGMQFQAGLKARACACGRVFFPVWSGSSNNGAHFSRALRLEPCCVTIIRQHRIHVHGFLESLWCATGTIVRVFMGCLQAETRLSKLSTAGNL